MDSATLDQIRRNIVADEQRLVFFREQVQPGEDWVSLREDLARIERQIDRQRAFLGRFAGEARSHGQTDGDLVPLRGAEAG